MFAGTREPSGFQVVVMFRAQCFLVIPRYVDQHICQGPVGSVAASTSYTSPLILETGSFLMTNGMTLT